MHGGTYDRVNLHTQLSDVHYLFLVETRNRLIFLPELYSKTGGPLPRKLSVPSLRELCQYGRRKFVQ